MANQFPFTTGCFKQAVNLAGTALDIWSLSPIIVHFFDLFGMIYNFNDLKRKRLGQIQTQICDSFVRKLSKRPRSVFFLNPEEKKKKKIQNKQRFLNSFATYTRLVHKSECEIEEALSKPGLQLAEMKETTAWIPRRRKPCLDLACQLEVPCETG